MTRVLLLGLMGSGKSTVGSALGELTGWPVLDNDVLLQRSTGSTAAQLLEKEGLASLRSAESDVLTLTLAVPAPLVAGVAAGVVLDDHDRARVRDGGHVVWLRAPVSTLVRRVARGGEHRPLLDGDPATALRAMAAEREPLFAEVATQVVDVVGRTPEQVAREVLSALRG